MQKHQGTMMRIALTVALGGLLMGFDASVISGVVGFIEQEFQLNKWQIGWSVSSLTLTATAAMMLSGPLSNRIGRRRVLQYAAIVYTISAIGSALSPDFVTLVIFRMIGGFGVGASLIIAPMYIAEIAPASMRGKLVSFNQLNIVIGISLAFFTNYLILRMAGSGSSLAERTGIADAPWRWMLGIEAVPAILYFAGLFLVPRSPRWLMIKGRWDDARKVLVRFSDQEETDKEIAAVRISLGENKQQDDVWTSLRTLFLPAFRQVLLVGIVLAVLQQITGINSVFFYAPMIFEQSGIGTDASFVQAILVGLTNLVFTILAILYIDRIGRKPLLTVGVAGIALSMLLLAFGFSRATYTIQADNLNEIDTSVHAGLLELEGDTYTSDVAFKDAVAEKIGAEQAKANESAILAASIDMNPVLILIGILGFVASFAMSIGPVMWVMFSELFPNHVRGVAVSLVGLINSAVSFLVQLLFPWELAKAGSSLTFLIYGVFAVAGLWFIVRRVPETKGKTLEELEKDLIKTT